MSFSSRATTVCATSIAIATFTPFPAMGQDLVALAEPVIVTATRFTETEPRAAANVSVITRDDIQTSASTNVPGLLGATAGVEVRPLYGPMGIDATVDLRGFGDTAGSNTLILLDGQRLNPIDSGSISWSTVPRDSILRIEVVRGAGTVLYGDQASGGVINIITDKSSASRSNATATVGSYGYRGLDANLVRGNDDAYINLYASYADTNGWRDNAWANQQALSGRLGRHQSGSDFFLDFAVYKDSNGLPGSLTSADFRDNPTRARTPQDAQRRDGYRLRPGTTLNITPQLTLEAELAADHDEYHTDNVYNAARFDRNRDTLSATPRLRWAHGLGTLRSESVLGFDYYDGRVGSLAYSNSFGSTPQGANQVSAALYFQNITEFTDQWNVSLGMRRQRVDQRANQDTSPGFSGGTVRFRDAADLGLVYQGDNWRAFGRTGTIFRFATTDELFGFDPINFVPVFAGDLKPQHGRLRELGASVSRDRFTGRLSVYRIELQDEIAYDGTTFANVNLAPTLRRGVESELTWSPLEPLSFRVAGAITDASFRDGPNAGHDIPLVAHRKASLQALWKGGASGSYTLSINHVGKRRYSGDAANQYGYLDAYTTVDLQGSWNLKPWTITAKLLNAFDKRYAPFALHGTDYKTGITDLYYFPADGRSLFVSARYDFR